MFTHPSLFIARRLNQTMSSARRCVDRARDYNLGDGLCCGGGGGGGGAVAAVGPAAAEVNVTNKDEDIDASFQTDVILHFVACESLRYPFLLS